MAVGAVAMAAMLLSAVPPSIPLQSDMPNQMHLLKNADQ